MTVASGSISAQEEKWQRPLDGAVSYGYFSEAYSKSEGVQHVGVDIDAEAGEIVRAPAAGSIIINRTGRADIMNAYLILREEGTGIEHVLAHISSNLPESAHVERGDIVGVVREWSGNEHVHWGVFRGNMIATFGNGWGFGRIPNTASATDAHSKGWIDPLAESTAKTKQPSNRIPARFRGYWDCPGCGCSEGSDGSIVITETGIGFFDAESTIISVTDNGEETLIKQRVNAEGFVETRVTRLLLVGEGANAKLLISDGTKPAGQDQFASERVRCGSLVSRSMNPFADYQDNYLGTEKVEVRITASARRRDYPSTEGTTILDKLAVGTALKGRWVKDIVNDRRWLKISSGGYVWDGVLARKSGSPLIGSWRLTAERSTMGDQKWIPIASSERETVTFRDDGGFRSDNRRSPRGSYSIEQTYDWGEIQISGWLPYHVSAKFEGDRMIVTHQPFSSINAYDRLWLRATEVGAVNAPRPGPETIASARITTDGMFGIKVGMRIRDISNRLVFPGFYGSRRGQRPLECEIYKSKDGKFNVLTEDGIVAAVLTASTDIQTLSGAKVGMTSSQLRAIYGSRLIREENPYSAPPGADYFVFSSSGNGVKFSVNRSDKVYSITAGGSAIRLIEGCS